MRSAVLYRHFDAQGRLLYVGISMNVMQRIMSHSRTSWWFPDIARIELEHFPNRDTANRAEIEAILSEKPLHNMNYTRQNLHEINRNIALSLSDEQIKAAEADYRDMEQDLDSVSMKHRIGLSTMGFLFGTRSDRENPPWKRMSALW